MANQLRLDAGQPHANQRLFTNRYLNVTLPRRAAWIDAGAEVAPVFAAVRQIFGAYSPSPNEAQTEHALVRPILAALGHTFELQASLKTPYGTKQPDYLFYHDAAALESNKGLILAREQLGAVFAVGDAKGWDRPLDRSIKGTLDAISKVPTEQIAFYMRHSGVPWGILTNGRRWRLYHKDTVERQDQYYEVDLKALVDAGKQEDFMYFYAFFRRAAFEPLGPLALATMLQESSDYARGVSENLRLQVFDALRHVAQGFLDYPDNQLEPEPKTLHTVYHHSLIILYRLLFILYAEARGLLPLHQNRLYREHYSLYKLVRLTALHLDNDGHLLPTSSRTWAWLHDLFAYVNAGEPKLTVALFDGGLFDVQHNRFVATHVVGDAQLQLALDKLARIGKEYIDYRDLAERHLGTIYEGLLEYHLRAIEPTGDGFTIDLFNAKGERQRTGSYYTPDFVVQYILEQTLQPILEAAVAGKPGAEAQLEAVLALNCLDPAMGSGHFLVAAVEYIAGYLVKLGVTPPAEAGDEADLLYWKRQVAQRCIYGVDINPLAVDLAKLSLWLATAAKGRPLSFLDHHLRCGNALVGRRVTDPELLVQQTKQAAAPEQSSMLTDAGFAGAMRSAVGTMGLIVTSASRTFDDVKDQERLYEQIRHDLVEQYALHATLRTAAGFEQELGPGVYESLYLYAQQRNSGTVKRDATLDTLLAQAEALAAEHRFFHWDLEFPEIFFDHHGRPLGEQAGFDLIFGNPPYVRHEQFGPLKPYLAVAYAATYSGTADLSTYFLNQGVQLLANAKQLSYITSGTFQKLASAASLRAWLTSTTTLQELVHFGEHQIFRDATTYPIIITLCKALPPASATVRVRQADSSTSIATKLEQDCALPTGASAWVFVNGRLRNVLEGWSGSQPLLTHLDGAIYRGVTTGFNRAFVINEEVYKSLVYADQNSSNIIKPFVRGAHLHAWYREDSGLYLIFARRGIDIIDYPAISQYLSQFYEQLMPQPKDWDSSIPWEGRKAGNYKWFEIQDSVDYCSVFERPRIHSTKITLHPCFSLNEATCYAANTSYVLPLVSVEAGWYLLGLLNSRVSEWYGRTTSSPKANGYYELQPEALGRFPIPDAPVAQREALATLARQLAQTAQMRYRLQQRTLWRISADLGGPGVKLNQRLKAWWHLDFAALRTELRKCFKRDIPLKERDEWEAWFHDQHSTHTTQTAAIVAAEQALNEQVYQLFDLSSSEVALIEARSR
ncbi:Eco57I restriction-modification methylase domain-containing protein [Candidatus Viridilinea mediisalina]|uniref:site-specific DNA-methyltransferase (adenine-specific) n=1 Tax=Candidatus Viridilinea mediisalina TaxID=2024553 RepID=A0A2A6RKN5_9CHLR|nr:TaqI-like C-terminal specificity domain-containing protein [Candidatus Viridilinea mediisalina]PDW03637.1 hypothetical protein CJ255_07780 [Candidatus Viridilinea mediisalina]